MKKQLISLIRLEKAWRSNIPTPSFTPRARILPNIKSKGRNGNKRIFNVIKCVICLKSILLCHIHAYTDCFVCVFSFLPVSRTNTAILLSHNCFLAPSTHSSRAASQIHHRKELLPQLTQLTASPALSSLDEDWFSGERQGGTSTKRRGSTLRI